MIYRNLSLKQTEKLAAGLAKDARKSPVTIGLIGNLGAGKTTFAKAFAKQLRVKNLKSPTFIVNQRYKLSDHFLYHMDFYRLDHPKQLEPLGLSEILSLGNIVLIEWVDKFSQIMEQCNILVTFKVKPKDKRDVYVRRSKVKGKR